MIAKRTMFRIIVILLAVSIVVFLFLDYQEKAYQNMQRMGWTQYLQEFSSGTMGGSLGIRHGEMVIDRSGNIWVIGTGVGLKGLHMFDGTKWIQQGGGSTDLSMGPNGEIWVVRGKGLDVFDGNEWKDYPDILGADIPYISQVEVDSNGRIWITANKFGTDILAEVILQEGKTPSASYDVQFTVESGAIRSLDADNQGKVWAAISKYHMGSSRQEDELRVFDGNLWKTVDLDGKAISGVVRTAFDRQGRIWIATECGDVMTYSNEDWTSILEGDPGPDCLLSPHSLSGIRVDNKDRVWIWDNDKVRFLDDDKWTDLTRLNSGMSGSDEFGWIFQVVVDGEDQVWVGSANGVSMAPIQSIKPLPESTVRLHQVYQSRLKGMDWFIPSLLILLWLAVYFDIWPGVLVAAILGILLVLATAPVNGSVSNAYPLFPGGIVTYLGVLGGALGGVIGKTRKSVRMWLWTIGFALLCLVVSAVALFYFMLLISP